MGRASNIAWMDAALRKTWRWTDHSGLDRKWPTIVVEVAYSETPAKTIRDSHIKRYGDSLDENERRCTGEYALVRHLQLRIVQRRKIKDAHSQELLENVKISQKWLESRGDALGTTASAVVTGHQKGGTDETMMSGGTLNATLRTHKDTMTRPQERSDITTGGDITNTSLTQLLAILCLDFPRGSQKKLTWCPRKPCIY
ncbi:hypothetical protein N7501_002465 [Penicillium viridicatum]|nr:hypothetical protein N7501_002465 [Penicillium viridicatum]